MTVLFDICVARPQLATHVHSRTQQQMFIKIPAHHYQDHNFASRPAPSCPLAWVAFFGGLVSWGSRLVSPFLSPPWSLLCPLLLRGAAAGCRVASWPSGGGALCVCLGGLVAGSWGPGGWAGGRVCVGAPARVRVPLCFSAGCLGFGLFCFRGVACSLGVRGFRLIYSEPAGI